MLCLYIKEEFNIYNRPETSNKYVCTKLNQNNIYKIKLNKIYIYCGITSSSSS